MTYYIMLGIYIANFIFSISIVFIERRKPEDAMLWLLILSLVPLLGFIFFIFCGSSYSLRIDSTLRRKSQLDLQLDEAVHRLVQKTNISSGNTGIPAEYLPLARMLENIGHGAYTRDNHLELLTGGQAFYERLLEDIAAAQRSIHVEFFIFAARDDIGRKFLEALAERARAGVDVCVIYDACGDLRNRPRDFKVLRQAGARVYRHLPSMIASLFNANYLNHRKIVVIDGAVGYTGGINIGDAYLGLHKRCTPWRDTMVRITGSAVADLQIRFMKDWSFLEKRMSVKHPLLLRADHFPPPAPASARMGVQIISGGPDTPREPIKNGMIAMIYSAKERVFIQSPYLVPDDNFASALKNAAASGVRVDLMLPGIGDKSYVYHVTTSNIEALLEAGVRVHLYDGFLHAKMMGVDGKISTVGTTNIDIRSFQLNFEVNAFVYDEGFGKTCQDCFDDDLKSCREITLKEFRRRGILDKFFESVYRLFSPIM